MVMFLSSYRLINHEVLQINKTFKPNEVLVTSKVNFNISTLLAGFYQHVGSTLYLYIYFLTMQNIPLFYQILYVKFDWIFIYF